MSVYICICAIVYMLFLQRSIRLVVYPNNNEEFRKETMIRKKLGHTAVLAIKASSVTL